MANTFELISAVTVGSGGASSIDFTSIPSTYTDLCFVLSVRSSSSYGGSDTMVDDMKLTFNGSTAANYNSIRLAGNGSALTSTSFPSVNAMQFFYIDGSGATSSTFSNTSVYVTNYAGSTNKALSAETVGENNAAKAYMNILAGSWNVSSAINSTSFSLVNGNFVTNSTAYLYGVKNA